MFAEDICFAYEEDGCYTMLAERLLSSRNGDFTMPCAIIQIRRPYMDTQPKIHPEKWRETCDPFALRYSVFNLEEVLGYPHAGNDVFYVRGSVNGAETRAYIKAARHKDAAIVNEVDILSKLDEPIFPKIIDYDRETGLFSVTREMRGQRLSVIVGDNDNMESASYMEEYGETLAYIHKLNVDARPQADRRFHHRPSEDALNALGLSHLNDFFAKEPQNAQTVFCHGDFHYANVLWDAHHISAVLDFELAGYGNRDFDIAWALFLRPSQRFLKTEEEIDLFIQGYQRQGECCREAIRYYMAQCYVHFLGFCKEADYTDYARAWLERNCT